MENNRLPLPLEEEPITPRVIFEQAACILCVLGFLITCLFPFIIADALGSVAPVFSRETDIVLSAGEASSQTRFFYDLIYMLQNSSEFFVPLRVFVVGAQWITSSVGAGADFLGFLGLAAMAILYVLPVVLYTVLKVSRFVESPKMDTIRKTTVLVCGCIYLLVATITGIFVIGYHWNFFWEFDSHYDFAFQFFMAYGGLKLLLSMIISLLLAICCGILVWVYRRESK